MALAVFFELWWYVAVGYEERSAFGQIRFALTRDGRRLQYMRRESDADVSVVFESGLGFAHSLWGLVQPEVAAFADTVVYCRAGYGGSDVDPTPRTIDRMSDDLGDPLARAVGAHLSEGRVVLVGHSLGALITMVRVNADPARIAGLVLVDPVSPDMATLHTKGYRLFLNSYGVLASALASIGVMQWAFGRIVDRSLPHDHAAEAKHYESTRTALRNRTRESQGWLASLVELGNKAIGLPDIPAAVLSATRTSRFASAAHRDTLASHQRLAATTRRGQHISVPDTGHSIQLHKPAAVIEAIRRIVDQIDRP
ncbi:alpha/beta hydrolase [Nocardia terpenica]|uniref:alpha/beta fold hydrolase n=1 Tax=Nocardia terpenica TaxID=455432 RepID=UPI001892E72B|nr:alpha/beta hydrolase [Nocardia terpenica]MBF6062029.1 alpha/beta hydrolase [Nocardia terpenica]MBF6106171.1 alpha/beta hydrolase [Nocardia terpenica]MBF6110449.1 alpha/beta hydrolase [Nocardia terpenica]MBF6120714.1 alpha/beta hydrolase [Nocardia terpenica]MBF6151785.1 alpha/beta hydrolase [Nocardia terpenica]